MEDTQDKRDWASTIKFHICITSANAALEVILVSQISIRT